MIRGKFDMLRDKDYLRTRDHLIFNVIGYDHAPGHATANLKYVHGTKWTGDYQSAIDFLKQSYPAYVAEVISVPEQLAATIFRPQERLRQLKVRSDRNPLEQATVELAGEFADFFGIPQNRFGVTDSLLWGRGEPTSDVDLVVYGSDSASVLLERMDALYHQPQFERLTRTNYSRTSICRAAYRDIYGRRVNKGLYRGVRFSLRAVREYEEIEPPVSYHPWGPIECTSRVADHSQSLFFPAIYTLDSGLDVVSYWMQYEGIFKPGDLLTVTGTLERGDRDRIVIGSLSGPCQGIQLKK